MQKIKEKTRFIGAKVPNHLAEWLAKAAKKDNRDLTKQLINLLEEAKNARPL